MEFNQLCQSKIDELILEISIILGQLWKTQCKRIALFLLALESNLHIHLFILSLFHTSPILSADIIIHSPPLCTSAELSVSLLSYE